MTTATEYRTININGVIVQRPIEKFTPAPVKVKPKFKQGYGKIKSAAQIERERIKNARRMANRAARVAAQKAHNPKKKG